jgi:hypothetical protein
MRLPGTRYQEHGWEQVRKLLGLCSLQALAHLPPARLPEGDCPELLATYVDTLAEALREAARSARAEAPGNSYGDSVLELATGLAYELQARPGDWSAFCAAVRSEHERIGAFWSSPGGDAILRKKVNDMFAVLRDKVDSDNYQAACGRECSANKMYTYRMLDTAYGEIARLFGAWQQHLGQVGAILGRAIEAMPIEARQLQSIGQCKPEWIIRWSETLERYGDGPGPLHTRSKRFASLKNSPDKIRALMQEIGDYEELSSNRDCDWLLDADGAAGWLDDYWRVLDEAEPAELPVSPSPRKASMDSLALPVRLAVYLKMLGPADDSYPDEWLDKDSGELPTMAQLAQMGGMSLPTLRKRRDEAIANLRRTQ